MAKLVAAFKKELGKAFLSDNYEKQKYAVTHSFEERQDELLAQIRTAAEQQCRIEQKRIEKTSL